jgi:NurA-like 5'-3' nuclease
VHEMRKFVELSKKNQIIGCTVVQKFNIYLLIIEEHLSNPFSTEIIRKHMHFLENDCVLTVC